MRKAVIGVDGSKYSMEAFDYASTLLHPDEWELVLVHILDEVLLDTVARAGLSLEEFLRRNAENALGPVERKAERMGYRVKRVVRSGKPHDEIINVAVEEGAELIVVGSRGMRGLKRLILGSVSSYIASNSPVPVLIVHTRGRP